MLTHTGAKPHCCSLCPSRFSQSNNLKRHNLLHSGLKPHACPFDGCGMAFRQKVHVKEHVHFYHTEAGQAERKREEMAIVRVLDAAGIPYKREHEVDFRCVTGNDSGKSFSRIDFLLLLNGGIVALEVRFLEKF